MHHHLNFCIFALLFWKNIALITECYKPNGDNYAIFISNGEITQTRLKNNEIDKSLFCDGIPNNFTIKTEYREKETEYGGKEKTEYEKEKIEHEKEKSEDMRKEKTKNECENKNKGWTLCKNGRQYLCENFQKTSTNQYCGDLTNIEILCIRILSHLIDFGYKIINGIIPNKYFENSYLYEALSDREKISLFYFTGAFFLFLWSKNILLKRLFLIYSFYLLKIIIDVRLFTNNNDEKKQILKMFSSISFIIVCFIDVIFRVFHKILMNIIFFLFEDRNDSP